MVQVSYKPQSQLLCDVHFWYFRYINLYLHNILDLGCTYVFLVVCPPVLVHRITEETRKTVLCSTGNR